MSKTRCDSLGRRIPERKGPELWHAECPMPACSFCASESELEDAVTMLCLHLREHGFKIKRTVKP